MKEAEYIKAINEADPSLKVDEALNVKHLKAIYDGQQNAKKLAEAEALVKNLEGEVESLKSLGGENQGLKEENESLKLENASLTASYKELQSANQEEEVKAKAGIKGPTVKLGQDLYRTTGKALRTLKDGAAVDIPAAELVKDQKLCKELVKNQSGFLVKVELKNEEES